MLCVVLTAEHLFRNNIRRSTPVTVAALSTVQLMVTALDGGLPRAMRAVLTEVP